MGNYRSDSGSRGNRSNGRFGGRSDGRSSGGRVGNRSEGRGGYGQDRYSRSQDRRPREMYDITCDKCKRECQVPFRPSGNKPVLCSDCFKNDNNSNNNFNSRNQDRLSQSGMTSEQFNILNKKLDKIILVLQELEIDEDDEKAEPE